MPNLILCHDPLVETMVTVWFFFNEPTTFAFVEAVERTFSLVAVTLPVFVTGVDFFTVKDGKVEARLLLLSTAIIPT
ncbi:MAG TPA: hypothetical protein VEY70_14250 [Metabacillus sp.]|nr:hypothetical protein [Metabacillus sp.]